MARFVRIDSQIRTNRPIRSFSANRLAKGSEMSQGAAKCCTSFIGGNQKYPSFFGAPLFYKAFPRQVQPPERKSTPSKMYIGEGKIIL